MITGRKSYELPRAGKAVNGNSDTTRRFELDYSRPYGYAYSAVQKNDHRSIRSVSGIGAEAGRQSLSALDDKRASELRQGVYAHVFLDVKNRNKSDAK